MTNQEAFIIECEIKEVLQQHPDCLHVKMEAGSCQLEHTLNRAIRRELAKPKLKWCSRWDLNPDQRLRRPSFYPLNYGNSAGL
jgi:hypothetical protein